MGSLSDYAENKVLDHVWGKAAFTYTTPLFLALLTVVPTDASTGATITEATYTGYARLSVAAADWASAAAGANSNANALTFAACTAGASTIVAIALLDSVTIGAGNIHWWTTTNSKVIDTSNTPATISASNISGTMD